MVIDKVELLKVRLTFKSPFEISSGRMADRDTIIVRATTRDGIVGYGEAPPFTSPIYSSEFTDGAILFLKQHVVPAVLNRKINGIDDLYDCYRHLKGNNMAKCGLESAFWHILAQEEGKPLSALWGGTRKEIPVGVSLGLEDSVEEILAKVTHWVEVEKTMRVKIKIKPGMDIEPTRAIREKYPDIMLMLDANSAYTLDDMDLFKELDRYNLLMIEQPLAHDDIIDHATLQEAIETPICLDESILSPADARKAIQLGACRIINIKPPRVGGFWQAKLIAELAGEHGIPVWSGGMLESGWARSMQIQIASLPNYSLPSDICKTERYFEDDIIDPYIQVKPNSHIDVPQKTGTGFRIDEYRLARLTVESHVCG